MDNWLFNDLSYHREKYGLCTSTTNAAEPTDASQLLTEDQKQELLPRLNKLNQIASDFARQQEVTTEYTVKKREVLEHLIEQKVKDSVLSNSNFRVRAEEAVDTSLSNMKPNLKLLEVLTNMAPKWTQLGAIA